LLALLDVESKERGINMILSSILIDNTYGTNISRIIFYGKNIIEFEEEILKNNNFYTEVDKKNKDFL